MCKVQPLSRTSGHSGSKRAKRGFPDAPSAGFSLIELMISVTILLVIAGFAVPRFLTMTHTARLRGTASDFSGLIQSARINAIKDDRYYSAYTLGGRGFVDMYPKSNTGASGSGGTVIDTRDPQITLSAEVVPITAGNAPATANLSAQFLPAGSGLAVKDGGPGSGTPITFGPRGLPCTPQLAAGGAVCDSAGGATAFWAFFQNSVTLEMEAITISPAGRIRKWY